MTANLLSPVHIQKLGHPIDEIRSRALQSVWSKYNLDLIDYSNLENTKLLWEKLMHWFNFKIHPHEEKVFKLILKLLKQPNALCIVNKSTSKKILMKMEEIKHCVDSNFLSLIEEIQECIKEIDETSKDIDLEIKNTSADASKNFDGLFVNHEIPTSDSNKVINIVNLSKSESPVEGRVDNNILLRSKCPKIPSDGKEGEISETSCPIKIDYFTWQLLTLGDASLLTSVYEGLRYVDHADCILKSCQFYTDVLLKDFPVEIFLQRTLLMQTFFELLKCEDSQVSLSVLACLVSTMKHLHKRFQSALDISVIYFNGYDKTLKFNKNKLQSDGPSSCMNSKFHSTGSDTEMEEEVFIMESDCYSVTQICFSILSEATTLLSKRKSAEEYNITFELILETVHLLAKNINRTVWSSKCEFKSNVYKIFNSFHDSMKYHKNNDQITYNIIVHIVIKTLIVLKLPEEELNEVLPYSIQMELVECVSDYIFILLYPHLNSKLRFFVERFLGQRKNEVFDNYKDSLEVCHSMKSAIEFLKYCNKLRTKSEKLNHIRKALPSLEFHRNIQFIQDFVKICLFKWSEKQLNENELQLRKDIVLKLLSHNDDEIKLSIYKELHAYVIKYLVDTEEKPKFQHLGIKFMFLCNHEILSEIICHGLNSPQPQVQYFSSEIIINILKGKPLFSDHYWQKVMGAFTPYLPLLQCYADKTTPLGRCILKMLDPDISGTILLSPLELLKGNLRLLFSKNHLIREEALLRLFWLLAKEDPDKKKLPRLNLLRGINLSSICSSVAPGEYCNLKQSFYSTDALCNVMEMLTAENIEPSIRRSALSQLSVMLEDLHLQPVFLEQNGLPAILDIFKNCLIENEFQNYPDSVLPVMNILKLICLDNSLLRLQLSQDVEVYYCILRGLLLFSAERHTRQQGVELLCLLLYNECIINTGSERAAICKISLPQVLINKICLPFLTYAHSKYSKNAELSNREPLSEALMLKEKTASLLRIFWNSEWIGGVSQLLSLEADNLENMSFPPFLSNDMRLKTEDLKSMRYSSFTFGIKCTLFDIQNATTHKDVMASLNRLNRYLLLYKLERNMKGAEECSDEFTDITSSLSKLQWEITFERFFISIPSCEDDEVLLLHVVRSLQFLLKTIKSENLTVWIEKFLTDINGTLPNIFKCCGKQSTGIIRKDLTRAVTGLIKDMVVENPEHLNGNWLFYISILSRQLKLRGKHEFYEISHIECLMNVLVDITGNLTKNTVSSAEFYNETITGLMEIIITLHCSKDSQNSFLGINLIKNCLHILNHILAETQLTTKNWEHFWYHALSQVTGHTEQPNYCWLLSLWFVRDPIIRALAIQFLVGFSITCSSCELLIEGLYIEFEYVWNECFKLLLDDNECNLVKEKAALLLSNLTFHGYIPTASGFLQNLIRINFYDKLHDFFEKLLLNPVINGENDSQILEHYYRHCEVSDDCMAAVLSKSSTSFVSAVCLLLLNTLFLKPEEVGEIILKSNLLESLVKIFNAAPEACHIYMNEKHVSDLIIMYTVCCKIILKCMIVKHSAFSYIQQSQHFVSSLYCIVNYSLFDKNSKTIVNQRNQLWCEVLDILSIILTGPHEAVTESEAFQTEGFKALDYSMTENGTDYFISSLYIAITSCSCDLRLRSLRFLTNLFGIEGKRLSSLTIADILDRNIFLESVQQAGMFGWKGFSICKQLDLNFTNRVCDILLQALSLNSNTEKTEIKTSVSEALGNLLAICKNSKKYCVDRGLVDDILENLRTLFIKLRLENIDCMKKFSERKRLDPMLLDIETNYRLLGNLLLGDENIKSYAAGVGFSSLINKLWYWCTASYSLHITTLKLLTIFTFKSEPASRALVSDKSWNDTGIRKPHGSATLLNTIMQHVEKEIQLMFKSRNSEVVRLSFQLLENCCNSSECRSHMAKGSFFSYFKNIFNGFPNKRRPQADYIIEAWCNFFVIFTSYQEGQLVLTKDKDVLQTMIIIASSSNSIHRKKALKVLRNISFHQLNRVQLLSHYQFLSVLLETLKSGQTEEISLTLHAIWGLVSNSHKAKITIKNSGFEYILKEVKKKLILLSCCSPEVSVIDRLLLILQNK